MKLEMKNKIIRIVIALIGTIILGFGLGLTSAADIGSDSLNGFLLSMYPILNISYGQMNTLLCVFMIVVTFIVYRKNIGLATILALLITQYPMDFVYNNVTKPDSIALCLLLFIVGDIIISLGVALIIKSDLGMSDYEAFYFSFANRFHWNFVHVKYVCDAAFLLIVLLLDFSKVGIGTIISYLLTGKLIEFFNKKLDKLIKYE